MNPGTRPNSSHTPPRPWIGVRFTCRGRYVRVSRHPDADQYLARCPDCGLPVRFTVAHSGTDARFFEVDCAS